MPRTLAEPRRRHALDKLSPNSNLVCFNWWNKQSISLSLFSVESSSKCRWYLESVYHPPTTFSSIRHLYNTEHLSQAFIYLYLRGLTLGQLVAFQHSSMANGVIQRRENQCPFIEPASSPSTNGCPFYNPTGTLHWTHERPIELHNYQTNQSMNVFGPTSTLYQDCRHGVCTSTFMSLPAHPGDSKSAELQSHSREYIRKEAYDFLAIYRQDKTMSDEDYDQRLEQIDVDIHNTGVYQLTTQELEYGCQLAWRNAARCINRLFWSSLKVIDRRHVNTNDQMFAEICDHIREAYNKGTLQATTLVLGRESRMWSTQYFRFACYEQEDGSMLGDPANRELTKVAMELGWNKPQKQRTQWDLLPIIVQVDQNTPPSWYELPEDLRLIVFLSHPDAKYDAAIKKLGLRWVVQPFVADKAIEIGGIVFKCVPFSGWFMGTEIGRNLCDVQRYNFIPKIAALLDLDVTAAANSQLNVDRIYIEINAAVLHSFQRAKIAIVDHHTAATGFIKFMKQEVKQRGNTPADWVWLVPPVSSGMSVVFHQEMLNYVVKPRVLDQRDPWTYYTGFRRAKETSQTSSTVKRRHRWTLLHAARSIIGLALRAAKMRVAVYVLYASASGTAQSYAQQTSKRLAMDGYQTTLMMLDKYPFRQVTDTRALVLIITSTFGQGNAPEGGTEMEEWLKDEIKEVDERSNQSTIPCLRRLSSVHRSYEPLKHSLRWCTYAVCAIGSSAYPFFCGFGKLIDQTFRTLGAHQLVPLATCDALNQQYKSFNEWEETTVMTLKKMYPHVPHPQRRTLDHALPTDDEQISFNKSLRPSFIKLEFFAKNDATPSSRTIGPFTKENPYKAVVLQNIELTGAANVTIQSTPGGPTSLPAEGEGSATLTRLTVPSLLGNVNNDEHRSVRRIRLETPGLSFYPGDHVCILPENSQAHVVAIILACGWQRGHEFLTKPCSLGSLTNNQYVTLRQILTQYVDLVTTPRPHLLDTIATYATDIKQQRQLFELGKGGQRYVDWCVSLPTIKEMLDQFPSVRIPLEELIQVTSIFHLGSTVHLLVYLFTLALTTTATSILLSLIIKQLQSRWTWHHCQRGVVHHTARRRAKRHLHELSAANIPVTKLGRSKDTNSLATKAEHRSLVRLAQQPLPFARSRESHFLHDIEDDHRWWFVSSTEHASPHARHRFWHRSIPVLLARAASAGTTTRKRSSGTCSVHGLSITERFSLRQRAARTHQHEQLQWQAPHCSHSRLFPRECRRETVHSRCDLGTRSDGVFDVDRRRGADLHVWIDSFMSRSWGSSRVGHPIVCFWITNTDGSDGRDQTAERKRKDSTRHVRLTVVSHGLAFERFITIRWSCAYSNVSFIE